MVGARLCHRSRNPAICSTNASASANPHAHASAAVHSNAGDHTDRDGPGAV